MRIRLICLATGVMISVMSAPTADAGGFFKKLFGCKEEPTCCEPEPVCCPEPEPVCCPEPEPAPVCCEPAPEPEPCCPEPEPVVEPACCEPAPAPEPEPCCASTAVGVTDVASTAGLPAGAVIISTRILSPQEVAALSAPKPTQLVSVTPLARATR